jgi:hypothetical protein
MSQAKLWTCIGQLGICYGAAAIILAIPQVSRGIHNDWYMNMLFVDLVCARLSHVTVGSRLSVYLNLWTNACAMKERCALLPNCEN